MKNLKELSPQALLATVFMLSLMFFALVELFPSWLYRTMDIASYLVFHNMAEFFSVMVSLAIFSVGWFTYEQSRDRHALFLGCAFLAIGLMDFMHTLGYPGMPAFITPNTTSLKSTQFWIAVRMYAALAFLVSGFVYHGSSGRLLSKYVLLASAVAISGVVFAGVIFFSPYLPVTFVEGKGVTPIKIYAEYLIIFLLALSIPAYWRRYADTRKQQFLFYMAAFIICIFSELAFTLPKSAFDTNNVLGHLYKIIAFALIYQGIFIATVKLPYLELVSKSEELRTESDERKLADEALLRERALLRCIIDSASDLIFIKDRKSAYLGCNKASERLIGLPESEQIGKTDYDYFDQEMARLVQVNDRQVLEKGITLRTEEWVTYPDGHRVLLDTLKVPFYGSDGEVNGLVGICRDITERKQDEVELSLLAAIVESSDDAIIGKTPEGIIISWNKGAERLYGYQEEEVKGCSVSILIPDDRADELTCILDLVKQGKPVEHFETVRVRKDGSPVEVSVTVSPIYDAGGKIVGASTIARDITERKKTEAELRKLYEELERKVIERTAELNKQSKELSESQQALMNIVEDLNEKTAELAQANVKLREVDRLKSMFIASMSHELRTPLNSIIGFSSILHDEWVGPVNKEQKENLAIILRSGKHLLSLINDVIDVSKIEAGKIDSVAEEFDLHDLIDEAVSLVKKELGEKGLALQVATVHEQMHTDRRRLLQCLLNVLSNAMKYTEQGSVTVEARLVQGSGGSSEAGVVEISVTDTGIGIREDELSKMFQPFVRLASPLQSTVPGTGLGLYLSRKLAAEVLKGDILLESEYGKGSRFTIRIPVRLS